MDNPASDVKNEPVYRLGTNLGFFAGFLLFASALYFILNFAKKLPLSVKYYHALLLVVIVYFIGYASLKLRK